MRRLKDFCSLCNGRGYIDDYDDQWTCTHCNGTGNADGLEDGVNEPELEEPED